MAARLAPSTNGDCANRLGDLGVELDRYIARDYGVKLGETSAFEEWRSRHQPFHWFSEFYGVIRGGGFDVVIGNPPWKEYSKVKRRYTVQGYATESCGNLYALCSERSLLLCHASSRFSFIVQLPVVSSSRMAKLREILRVKSSIFWVATFDDRPGKLFNGLQHCRSAIFVVKSGSKHEATLTTRYQRWRTPCRPTLFESLSFILETDSAPHNRAFAKHQSIDSASALYKVRAARSCVGLFRVGRTTNNHVFYQEATGYWTKVTSMVPFYSKNGLRSEPPHGRYIFFEKSEYANSITALLNSSLFYTYFIAYSDCFHLSDAVVASFPINREVIEDKRLASLNGRLMAELNGHSERKPISSRRGAVVNRIEYDEYFVWRCKDTLDKIDLRLAELYSLSDEETDAVINYDIKHRMGEGGEKTRKVPGVSGLP